MPYGGSLLEILLVYLFYHLEGLIFALIIVSWLPDDLYLPLAVGQQIEVSIPRLMGNLQFVYV
jgi:hypothetical protein